MQLKRIPRYVTLTLLTAGASLILGFLSFGGMFALWPVLSLAFAAFGLSVAYEAEVYFQNIKGALSKLFKSQYLKQQLARDYLLAHFPSTEADDCPLFFKDYQRQLELLAPYMGKNLDKSSRLRKQNMEKTLGDMEKWFVTQLFPETKIGNNPLSGYEIELRTWLLQHQQREWQIKYKQRQTLFNWTKAFSVTAGMFMGLGTTYLLSEAFTVIPSLATLSLTTWPLFIVPMALVAGLAYGLLTYNAITDMIHNQTLRTWYNKIINDTKAGRWFIPFCGLVLTGLAVVLTICTAGTWWTVAKEAPPLFKWLGKMPRFIMGVINPIITSLSAIAFNLQNTSESLEIIDEFTHKGDNVISRIGKSIAAGINYLRSHENGWQIINPFRWVLKLTFLPLRILLFVGHLIGIGVTTDRVPGISQVKSALLGMFIEGLEDMHYFVPHTHHHHHNQTAFQHLLEERLARQHSHSHELDFPARILTYIFSPLFALAALWDSVASHRNNDQKNVLSFKQAWKKQHGIKEEKHVETDSDQARCPSANWQYQQAIYRIERYKEQQLDQAWLNQPLAKEKGRALTTIQAKLRELAPDVTLNRQTDATIATAAVAAQSIRDALVNGKSPIFAQHRFYPRAQTQTSKFIEQELPQRIRVLVSVS